MTNPVLMVAGLLILSIAGTFVYLFHRLLGRQRVQSSSPESWQSFSVEKYRPMERLLSGEDDEFLASQAGYDPRILHRLRRERRTIFRSYLRSLIRDFNRVYAALKVVLLHAAEDRPDLASALLKQRLIFAGAVAAVEGRLILHALGFGTVDARGLVESLDRLVGEFRRLAPRTEFSPSAA